jgi:hypothetical protein
MTAEMIISFRSQTTAEIITFKHKSDALLLLQPALSLFFDMALQK